MPVIKVFIILVNWNGKKDTAECLKSLKRIAYPNHEIIVVDNGSTDNSQEYLKTHFPQVVLIENKENLGFAGGCNLGIKFALEQGTDYVLLLNNDTIAKEDFLLKLIQGVKDENADIATGKIYYYDTPHTIWGAGGWINLKRGMGCFYGINQEDRGQFDELREISFISGCMMLIKKDVFEKIGYLDEKYFMYCEDVDFCLRALKKKLKLVYIPYSIILHKKTVATKIDQSPSRLYYFTRNSIFIVRKYSDLKQRIFFYFLYLATLFFQIIFLFKDNHFTLISSFLIGVIDALLNKSGKRTYDFLQK